MLYKSQHHECPRLPELKPVLACWIEALWRYHSEVGRDFLGYGERAQVGFLAGAAWLSGHVALEEWGTEKGPSDARVQGRCDLWINISDFHIEAKREWCKVTEPEEVQRAKAENCLDDAVACARRIKSGDNRCLAAAFLSPGCSMRHDKDVDALLRAWLKVVQGIPNDGMAWYFTDDFESMPSSGDFESFGIVLLLREV
jgi:hypothetical protein